jgi:hypothetical protein
VVLNDKDAASLKKVGPEGESNISNSTKLVKIREINQPPGPHKKKKAAEAALLYINKLLLAKS